MFEKLKKVFSSNHESPDNEPGSWEVIEKDEVRYLDEHPDSLIPAFMDELHLIGIRKNLYPEVKSIMSRKSKAIKIATFAWKYYQQAVKEQKYDEAADFISFLGWDSDLRDEVVIPVLLKDYQSDLPDSLKDRIAAAITAIASPYYIDQYVKLAKDSSAGVRRAYFIRLLARLQADEAVEILNEMMDHPEQRLAAIQCMRAFKDDQFWKIFNKYKRSKDENIREAAKKGMLELDDPDHQNEEELQLIARKEYAQVLLKLGNRTGVLLKGAVYVPDGLDTRTKTLSEIVLEEGEIYYSGVIKAEAEWAEKNGYTLQLFIDRIALLDQELQKLADEGKIRVFRVESKW